MPNVRLSFLCAFAPFSRRKFIQIFTADFQLCYGRHTCLHQDWHADTTVQGLGFGVGRGRGNWVEITARFSSLPVARDKKRGVWKSGNPESGIGTGIGTGTGTGTGIGTGIGRETYIKAGTTFTLRYLHRQIFNILFCTQNLSTVSSDDVICISGVLFWIYLRIKEKIYSKVDWFTGS